MRGLWIVFTLFPSKAPADRWTGSDKAQHFFMSAFVQSVSYGAYRSAGAGHGAALAGASMTTAAIGVGKEMRDARTKGEFSARDLVWDAAGAGAATVLLVRTRP